MHMVGFYLSVAGKLYCSQIFVRPLCSHVSAAFRVLVDISYDENSCFKLCSHAVVAPPPHPTPSKLHSRHTHVIDRATTENNF